MDMFLFWEEEFRAWIGFREIWGGGKGEGMVCVWIRGLFTLVWYFVRDVKSYVL